MSKKYENVLNEIKDNNFFENADINYKINFMLKTIDIIINETINDIDKLIKINKEYQVGYYNKAISEMCLNNNKDALEYAKNAKAHLMNIDINDKNSVKYCMYKYNEKIMHINKLNIIIKHLSSQLLDNDKAISDDESEGNKSE